MPYRNASRSKVDAMVESRQEAITHLSDAVDVAAASGVPGHEILTMVADRIKLQQMPLPQVETAGDIVAFLAHSTTPTPNDEGAVIYDELPPGLIDLPSASRKYGIALGTLHQWAYRGKIPRLGRLRGRATRGGFVVTSEQNLIMEMSKPKNKGGRPKKPV